MIRVNEDEDNSMKKDENNNSNNEDNSNKWRVTKMVTPEQEKLRQGKFHKREIGL